MIHFASYFALIPYIFLQSVHAATNELCAIPFITIIKTTTCFGTGVTSSTKSMSQTLQCRLKCLVTPLQCHPAVEKCGRYNNCRELCCIKRFLGAYIDCYSASSRYWNTEVRNKVCDISTVHNFHDTRNEFQKFIFKTKLFCEKWNKLETNTSVTSNLLSCITLQA